MREKKKEQEERNARLFLEQPVYGNYSCFFSKVVKVTAVVAKPVGCLPHTFSITILAYFTLRHPLFLAQMVSLRPNKMF